MRTTETYHSTPNNTYTWNTSFNCSHKLTKRKKIAKINEHDARTTLTLYLNHSFNSTIDAQTNYKFIFQIIGLLLQNYAALAVCHDICKNAEQGWR